MAEVVDQKRGTATVVFTDLVGSTELRSRLGENRADDLRRRHDEALAAVAATRSGVVVKSMGDGIMATFGSAADGVEAAIGFQQAVEVLGRDFGGDVQLRVGISAGDVVWENGDCFGLPVVEAARLESAAEPGQILCSAIAQILGGGRADATFEPVGDLELKGLEAPVAAFAVLWEPIAPQRPADPFAGRQPQLAEISEVLDGVVAGQGRTLLVAGEPGAGKTRLVTEALRGDDRVDVVWGHSYGGEVIPLGAVSEILDSLAQQDPNRLRAAAAHHDRVIAELAPQAAAAWVDVVVPDRLDLVEARQRVHSAVTDTLAAWTATKPLVVAFDDLHWADEMSVSLMRALARRTSTSPLVVVGTYRTTDLDREHEWGQALAQTVREVDPVQIDLVGLDTEEVAELLAALSGDKVEAELVEGLVSASGGNPLFVMQITRQLAESGAFAQDDKGVWRRVDFVELELPRGLRQVIGGRINRLSERTQTFLSTACMFESPFDLGLVAELADISEDDVLACLEEAETSRLLESTDVFDVYVFAHAMVRQTLYEEANPSRVVRAHRRIAEALETRAGDSFTGTQAAVIAHHYASSAVMPGSDAGVKWAVAAATAARDSAAYADALRNIAVAEELAESNDSLPPVLLRMKAETLAATGQGDATAAACAAAAKALKPAESAEMYATCCTLLHQAHGGVSTAIWDLASTGLPYCEQRQDDSWIILRSLDLQGIEFRDPDYIGIPTDSPELQEVRDTAIQIGYTGHFATFIYRNRQQMLTHPSHAAVPHLLTGELRRSIPRYQDQLDDAIRNGLHGSELGCRGMLARIYHAIGNLDAQRETMEAGIALYERTPYANGPLQFSVGYAAPTIQFNAPAPDDPNPLHHSSFGQHATWLDMTSQWERIVQHRTDPSLYFASAALRCSMALLWAGFGEHDAAMGHLEAIMPAVKLAPPGATNAAAMPALVMYTLELLGEVHWVDELRAASERIVAADFYYPEFDVRDNMGLLEAKLGNRTEALRWFGLARTIRTEQGATPHLALCDLREAKAELILDGEPGRIRQLLESSRPELERIGAHRRLREWDTVQAAL